MTVEERNVLLQEVFERALLQLRGHPLGRQVEQAIAHERRDCLHQQQGDHQQAQGVDPLDAAAEDAFVDDQPNHLRVRERGDDADTDEDRARRVRTPLLAHQFPERSAHRCFSLAQYNPRCDRDAGRRVVVHRRPGRAPHLRAFRG